MPISTNSVFHFTKNKTSLKNILKSNFRPSYCYETLELNDCPNIKGDKFEIIEGEDITVSGGIPMVSFCDIPLSQIKDHISKYGYYSLGLTKEWATKNGLNPVLYFERSSNLSYSTLLVLSTQLFDVKEDIVIDPDKNPLSEVFRYSKNNIGSLIRKGIVKNENYRFSDEREWRYCPSKTELNSAPFIISKTLKNYLKVKDKHNKEISSLRLDFEPSDISYIIIKKENEISELINHLENTKGKNYSYQDIRRLTTRIITSDQIINDF